MEYIVANSIFMIIALVGSFIINKSNEGIFMGINDFFTSIYLFVIGVIATIVNIFLIIIDFTS